MTEPLIGPDGRHCMRYRAAAEGKEGSATLREAAVREMASMTEGVAARPGWTRVGYHVNEWPYEGRAEVTAVYAEKAEG